MTIRYQLPHHFRHPLDNQHLNLLGELGRNQLSWYPAARMLLAAARLPGFFGNGLDHAPFFSLLQNNRSLPADRQASAHGSMYDRVISEENHHLMLRFMTVAGLVPLRAQLPVTPRVCDALTLEQNLRVYGPILARGIHHNYMVITGVDGPSVDDTPSNLIWIREWWLANDFPMPEGLFFAHLDSGFYSLLVLRPDLRARLKPPVIDWLHSAPVVQAVAPDPGQLWSRYSVLRREN